MIIVSLTILNLINNRPSSRGVSDVEAETAIKEVNII